MAGRIRAITTVEHSISLISDALQVPEEHTADRFRGEIQQLRMLGGKQRVGHRGTDDPDDDLGSRKKPDLISEGMVRRIDRRKAMCVKACLDLSMVADTAVAAFGPVDEKARGQARLPAVRGPANSVHERFAHVAKYLMLPPGMAGDGRHEVELIHARQLLPHRYDA